MRAYRLAGRRTPGMEDVLDAEGDAVQRSSRLGGQGVEAASLIEHYLRVQRRPCAHGAVTLGDVVENGSGIVDDTEAAGAGTASDFARR